MIELLQPFEIDRKSIADRVYQHIKQLILAGYLKGGEKVPEEKVAARFKVSRTPIREALRRLEKYGLIYIKPRSYAVVVDLRPDEAVKIAAVRFSLEKLACELFSEIATDADLEAIEKIAEKGSSLLRSRNRAEAFEADSLFHLEIARRTGNSHLFEILEKLDAKVQLLRLRQESSHADLFGYLDQHRALIELLRKKDVRGIAALLTRHIMHDLAPENLTPVPEKAPQEPKRSRRRESV